MTGPEADIIERLLAPSLGDGNAVDKARALLDEAAGEIRRLRDVLTERAVYPIFDMQLASLQADVGPLAFETLKPLMLEARHVVRSGDNELSVVTWTGTVSRSPTVLN